MVPSETRKHYAEEIRATARIASEALINAFGAVPHKRLRWGGAMDNLVSARTGRNAAANGRRTL